MSGAHPDRPTYRRGVASFSWSAALDDLGWSGRDAVDLAWTIVDRHAERDRAERTAVLWVGVDGGERRITFGQLASESRRFANLLRHLGVGKGDRVAMILPRIPEVMAVVVGTFRVGAILVPVFTGFGADAVAYRLNHSGAKVVCVGRRYRHLVPHGTGLTVIGVDTGAEASEGDIDYVTALANEDTRCPAMTYAREEPLNIIYTSGSTGAAKGCVIGANILAAMWPYARFSLDLRAETDVFWPTGDPSWGYGLCCYLPALAMGAAVLCVEANASPAVCREVLTRYRVTNLATTPTVLRSLMAEGDAIRGIGDTVRVISSCGEPLNAEVVEFFQRVWGVVPMDHFGATEFGLPIGNHNGLDMQVKPGSMGLPAPGQCMAIVDEDGIEVPRDTTGLIGQRNDDNTRYWLRYWNDEAATQRLRHGDWICTGDLARRDADGYFWFEGRADDIIKSAGYRIGPFEIESAILKHDSVAEAAVIGVPDSLRGQSVLAIVVPRVGISPSESFADEIIDLVKMTCGKHQAPREIRFVGTLPKTHSGKIQRFLLRRQFAQIRTSS